MSGYHDTALICLNGHVINSEIVRFPSFNRKFCDDCGAEAISTCPKCSKPIRGEYRGQVTVVGFKFPAPAFCGECGAPMPWTESRLRAAHDLIRELDELTPEDRARLDESIEQLARDTPQTEVAATRVKKIIQKVGRVAGQTIQKIATEVATEAAKKAMGL